MKCEVIIDENTEPKVVIYAKQKTSLVNEIERLCADDDIAIVGSDGNDSVLLEVAQISCFVVENDKVLAITSDGRYQIKGRLYQVEQMLSDNFVKINQSCIANIKMIKRFDASVSGQLVVYFKSGYRDFVSRRNIKSIKQKFGL